MVSVFEPPGMLLHGPSASPRDTFSFVEREAIARMVEALLGD